MYFIYHKLQYENAERKYNFKKSCWEKKREEEKNSTK